MKKLYPAIFVIFLFSITSFQFQKLHIDGKKVEWSLPICFSDSGYIQLSGPAMAVINSDNLIIPYLQSNIHVKPQDFRNINVYVKELKKGILSDTINFTNSIYNSKDPIIKTDNKGITHLLWGQNLTAPNMQSYLRSTDIYYSFYNDSVWSTPESIFHKDAEGINDAYVNPKLEIDSRNRLHLLWIEKDSKTGPHFNHQIEENCAWGEVKEIPFRTADYDYIFDKKDRLHLVYFRPENSGGYDENSVYYRFSDDYGDSWSDSVLVHKSGRENAVNVQILLDQKNNIHIIWTKNLTGNKWGGETIYHSFSANGIHWRTPENAVPQSVDGFLYFSAAIDKSDKIHLVYDLWGGFAIAPVKVCYSFYDGTNWSTPQVLFNDAEWPLVEIDSAGYLHLLYLDIWSLDKYYTRTTTPLITKAEEEINNVPDRYELYQNFPNPFNPQTTINYQLPKNVFVTIKVYDLLGKEVTTLVNEDKPPGYYKVNFDADKFTSGVYICTIKAGKYTQSKKMLRLK